MFRNDTNAEACAETRECSEDRSEECKTSGERSSESHDIAESCDEINERVVPLAPQEEDEDEGILDSEETSR